MRKDICLLTYRQIALLIDVICTDCTWSSTLFNTKTEIYFIKHTFVCINCFPCVTEKKEKSVNRYSYCLHCHPLNTSPWNNPVTKQRAPLTWVSHLYSISINTRNNCYCVGAKNKTDLRNVYQVQPIFPFLEHPQPPILPPQISVKATLTRYITGGEPFSLTAW